MSNADGINPDPSARVELDTALRVKIRDAMRAELVTPEEVRFLLIRMLGDLEPGEEGWGKVLGGVCAHYATRGVQSAAEFWRAVEAAGGSE